MATFRPAFPGGIRVAPPDGRTRERPIRQMDFAPMLHLPLDRSAESAGIVVRDGDDVWRGQLLARAVDEASVPVHAPASGRIVRIESRPLDKGRQAAVIHLAPFPGDTQECRGGRALDVTTASPGEIIDAIRDAGVAGLDAAGTPLHQRLRTFAGPPRHLLVNGIACDAGIDRSHRILRDQGPELRAGLRALLRASGAARATLAVASPDGDAAQAAVAAAAEGPAIDLRILAPRHPQGAEPLFLATVLDDPSLVGRRPIDLGALCVDLATVAEIGRLLPTGMPSTDVLVCLAGDALDDPGTWRMPLGTPLRFALGQAGLRPGVARVLAGGLLQGAALATLDVPVTSSAEGYLALMPDAIDDAVAEAPCIRCGDCLDACPVGLNPAEMGLLARKGEWRLLAERHDLDRCFECGCCTYVCPSRIPLVQRFRAAKMRRDRLAAQEAAA